MNTVLFPNEEMIGYHEEKNIIFISAITLQIYKIITFPFNISFFSFPNEDGLIAICTAEDPKNIIIWNILTEKEENHMSFNQDILNLSFSQGFILIITQNASYIIRISPFVLQYKLETPSPLRVATINSSPNDPTHALFAFTSTKDGSLIIRKVPSTDPDIIIEAHKSQIASICISHDNSKIATASQQGTLIRLWNSDGTPFHETRRGFTTAEIIHMTFSSCSHYLCVTSKHKTTHIFDVEEKDPSRFQNAAVRISIPQNENISCFMLKNNQNLLVVAGKGDCYLYHINIKTGENSLMTQMSIPRILKTLLPK